MRTPHAVTILALALAAASAAHAQGAQKLFFEGDMVRGGQVPSGAPCVLDNQFKHKEQVVFRVRVTDADGKNLDDKALKSLVIELSNGQKLPARFHGHPPKPPPTDFFWVAPWIIPGDFPTGSLSYTVTATELDGTTQSWQPFKVVTTQFTVLAETFEPPQK
jgi:hypothetical protein